MKEFKKYQFDENNQIKGMYSAMGELVKFNDPINPYEKDNPTQVRNVEDWLTEVETQMRNSLRDLLTKSGEAYTSETRTDWIFEWPA